MHGLAEEMVRRIEKLEPQHMSIAAWAHARLGLRHVNFLQTVAVVAARTAERFDAQGVGNIIWAYGVLDFSNEELIAAMLARAEALAGELSAQEISNIAVGLQALGKTAALRRFLGRALGLFRGIAGAGSGANWADLANAVADAVRGEGGDFPAASDFESYFRHQLLEPILGCLAQLAPASAARPESEVLESLQLLCAEGGSSLPYFGEVYTREALARLRLAEAAHNGGKVSSPIGFAPWSAWAKEARQSCFEAAQAQAQAAGSAAQGDKSCWRPPSTDGILAYASWSVECGGGRKVIELPGRVFLSARSSRESEGHESDCVQALLRPLRQHPRRDLHPERMALLELFAKMLTDRQGQPGSCQAGEDSAAEVEIKVKALLVKCRGAVRIYISQYPCISCLGVMCQAARHCPMIAFAVDFDNAWKTHFGRPRFSSMQQEVPS
ncbi:unnamed protein product [Polarella glacialis]|nr:unnamed protein product [Polarella glacialis]